MSNYVVTTDFAAKDALSTGNPAKQGKGTEVAAELTNIATAIATKEDTVNKGANSGYAGLDSGGRLAKANQHSSTAYLDAAANFVAGLQSGGSNVLTSLSGALTVANNLSDVANAGTARTNLGLGTLATQSGTFSGTSSGTNTGDQTNISGNAGTATLADAATTLTGLTSSVTELNYVDGVTSAIQTQIDTKLASASYTAADVLSKLLTVDGASSGLDADLLDGNSSAAFASASHNHAGSEITSGTVAKARIDADVYRGTLGSGNISAQSGGSPSGGSNGDIILVY